MNNFFKQPSKWEWIVSMLYAAWLNGSQRSRVGVGMNMSARGGTCKALWDVKRTRYMLYVKTYLYLYRVWWQSKAWWGALPHPRSTSLQVRQPRTSGQVHPMLPAWVELYDRSLAGTHPRPAHIQVAHRWVTAAIDDRFSGFLASPKRFT